MKSKTAEEIETKMKDLIGMGENTPYLGKLIDEIKDAFLHKTIRKYNIHCLENHIFSSEGYYNDDRWSLARLKCLSSFNFNNVEKIIADEFSKFSVKDRIEELKPNFDVNRLFNLKRGKSWYYVKKEMLPILDSVKKFPLSFYVDDYLYKARERINKILLFLKLAYSVDTGDLDLATHETTIKEWEGKINASQKDVVIKIHKEVVYITFAKDENTEHFRNMMQKDIETFLEKKIN